MRDYILIYINGKKYTIKGEHVFSPLSDFLRSELHLPGTKVVCSEGDCGACTVLCGRLRGKNLKYEIINSCICYIYQLDSVHIITVEGLKVKGKLNAVQNELVKNHGTQCGYCTPGFSVTMTHLAESKKKPSEKDIRDGLVGNLCRCTGYESIIESGKKVKVQSVPDFSKLYKPDRIINDFKKNQGGGIYIEIKIDGEKFSFYNPPDLKNALDFKLKNPDTQIISGGTDLGVLANKGAFVPRKMMSLGQLPGLGTIEEKNSHLEVGANAKWTSLEKYTKGKYPEFHKIINLIGSPQIKNVATIGGNVINASPIADSLPFLFITDSEIELSNISGQRRVKITEFYKSYKKMDIGPDEILTKIIVPKPHRDYLLKLYKVSKRKDLDIASFTAGIMMKIKGGTIGEPKLSYGGVGPLVYRLYETEKFLDGKPFSLETMREAGNLTLKEISPISDVRGSKAFRKQLAKNILLKYFYDCKEIIS
jgi:xanthine dehydrogenase small subunit